MSLPLLVVLGAAAAAVGSFGGIGGATLLVPVLLVFGVDPLEAAPLGLFAVAAGSLSAAARQLGEGLVHHRLGLTIELTASVGTVAGALCAARVPEVWLSRAVGIAALVGSLATLGRRTMRNLAISAFDAEATIGEWPGTLGGQYVHAGRIVPYQARRVPAGLALSSLAGVVAGLSGVGGGFLKTPAMSEVMGVPSKVAAAIGRDVRGLAHPLDVLLSAGFIRRTDDLLLDRRPTLRVADPIVRFHDLVIRPRLTAFEERRSEPAWRDAQSTIRSHVLGPAFEDLAREWVTRYSSPATLGGEPGEVGATVLNDAAGRSQHQLDVVVLAAGQRRRPPRPKVIAIGEAKDSDRGRTADDIARLEKGRDLLAARGVDTTDCKLLLFGRSGFEGDLHQIAERRGDIELIDLERIRSGA